MTAGCGKAAAWMCLVAALAGAPAGAGPTGSPAPPAPWGPAGPSLLAKGFRPNGIVVFLSDFGLDNDAVAVCKGVMLGIDPSLRIVDLTHGVDPFRVREGAIYLGAAADYYPRGTVFVGVVDPGVGTSRRALVLLTADSLVVVAPDNGLASLVARDHGVAGVWEIANPAFQRVIRSTTFDGRDLFSPSAARLASGRAAPAEAGPAVADMILLPFPQPRIEPGYLRGVVLLIDEPYGNVWTNIRREDVMSALGRVPARLRVRLGEQGFTVPLTRTFGDVPEGADLAYFNSRDQLSFAVNLGSFAATYGVEVDALVEVESGE